MICLAAGAAIAAALGSGYRAQFPLPGPVVSDGWGVNIHFTDPGPGEIDRIADAGLKWIRMDLAWSSVERKRGVYDFAAYDRLMAALAKRKMRAILILDYGNDLYENGAPTTPSARAAFAAFAVAAVRRYQGKGVLWETWNEPNGGFWQPRADLAQYTALAKQVAAAIRKACPQEWLVGPACAGFDWPWLQGCLDAGLANDWDAVTVHPYRGEAPDTVSGDWARLREMVRAAHPTHPVALISGEWGYSTPDRGLSEEVQAAYAVRQYLCDLASGVDLSIWYDWRDDGTSPSDPEHHFGLRAHDGTAKPAYSAVKALARRLAGYAFYKRLDEGAGVEALEFKKGSKDAIAAWRVGGSGPVALPGVGSAVLLGEAPAVVSAMAKTAADRLALDWAPLPFSASIHGVSDAAALVLRGLRSIPASVLAQKGTVDISDTSNGEGLRLSIHTSADLSSIRPGSPFAKRIEAFATSLPATHDYSDVARTLRFSVTVGGGPAVSQSVLLLPTRRMRFTIEPFARDEVTVEIANPTGRAFIGMLALHPLPDPKGGEDDLPEEARAPVRFKDGQTSGAFLLRDVPPEAQRNGFYLNLYSATKLHPDAEASDDVLTDVMGIGPVIARACPFLEGLSSGPLAGGPVSVGLDGDSKVAASVEANVTEAPGGLPLGGRALELKYSFSPGWRFWSVNVDGKDAPVLESGTGMFGFYLYGDGSGNVLRIRYEDVTGQVFQPTYGPVDWKGWRFVQIPVDGKAFHWGGAKDGKPHYPLRIMNPVLLDSSGKAGTSGTVWATKFTLLSSLDLQKTH